MRHWVDHERPTIAGTGRARLHLVHLEHGAAQPRALSAAERAEVLGVLHDERFVDQAPASIYASLLDDGRYLCSVPTMYRLLRAEDEVRERRRQATHPARSSPSSWPHGPNSVWSLGYHQAAGS